MKSVYLETSIFNFYMKKDIVIEEIREVRHRMSAECDHDVDRFFAVLKEEEKQFESQIRRYHEIERHYQEESASREEDPSNAWVFRDKPKH